MSSRPVSIIDDDCRSNVDADIYFEYKRHEEKWMLKLRLLCATLQLFYLAAWARNHIRLEVDRQPKRKDMTFHTVCDQSEFPTSPAYVPNALIS